MLAAAISGSQRKLIYASARSCCGSLWNAHGVHKEIGSVLCGDGKANVLIRFHQNSCVSRIVRRQPCLAAFHLVEDLVHDVGLYKRFLLLEKNSGWIHSSSSVELKENPSFFCDDSKSAARIVEHQNFPGIFFIPEDVPAVNLLCDILFVIKDADKSPSVGNGIFILRIIAQIAVFFVDILIIRDVVKIELSSIPSLIIFETM